MMTPELFAKTIASIEHNYGLRLDARSVWLRMDEFKKVKELKGGKCNESTGWYGLKGSCKRGKNGESESKIKESKLAIADKIRTRKISDRLKKENIQQPNLPQGRIIDVPTSSITIDEKRFGLKGGVNSQSLASFNSNYAGAVQTWKDPGDGKTYVVNGVKRLKAAKVSGEGTLSTMPIKAKNAKEAHEVGVLSNLASGSISGLDAGKFFHDSKIDASRLKKESIDIKAPSVRQGLAIAALEPSLYDRVSKGTLSPDVGEMIGSSPLSHPQQKKLMEDLEKESRFFQSDFKQAKSEYARNAIVHESVRSRVFDLNNGLAND